MKAKKQNKIFLLVIALSLIIPIAFALQAGFLEVKTLCLNGDCRIVWPANGANLLRTYTGISPITVDNDTNQVGLNVSPTDDWNGTFDGLDANEFTLDRAYDQEPGVIRRIRVDDKALIFDVNKATTGLPGIDLNFNMPYFACTGGEGGSCSLPEGTSGAVNFNLMPDGNDTHNPISRVKFLLRPQYDSSFETAEIIFEILPPVLNVDVDGSGSAFFIIRSREAVDGNVVDIFRVGNSISEILIPENPHPAEIASRGWRPIDDNTFNLGEQDFRWRDLFLAGTIKGQGEGATSEFVFDLSGSTGNFDTIGDGNYDNFLVRTDLNNNASGSDANFFNLEADNIFGTFFGSIGDSSDGNSLYVLLNPLTGQVISGATDLNHLDGNTFLGHTFFIGNGDDEVVLIQAFSGQTQDIFAITDSEEFRILTVAPNGETDFNFFASEDDGHALRIDVDSNGFANIVALQIDYVIDALGTEEEVQVILINVDQFATNAGQVNGIRMVTTQGDANLSFAKVGILIDPIKQLSGVFSDMDSAFVAGVDRLSEFTSFDSNIAMFVNNDDNILIGSSVKFAGIGFILQTDARNPGIKPVFEHSTGVGTFSVFDPTDTTNGMRNNGIISFDSELISDWVVGANSEFLIRITRTQNNLNTVPIEGLVQIAIADEFFWNKDGSIFVNDLNASNLNITGTDINLAQLKVANLFLSDNSIVSTSSFTFVSTQQFRYEVTPADTDIVNLFIGTDNTGEFDWMEDEDQFKFFDEILLNLSKKLLFRDADNFINSSIDSQLDLNSDGTILLTAIDVNISNNLNIDGNVTADSNVLVLWGEDQNFGLCVNCLGDGNTYFGQIGSRLP